MGVRRLAIDIAACLAVAAPFGLVGCGSSPPAPKPRRPAVRNVDPVPAERVSDVVARVEGAATASSCTAVKGLLHSVYGTIGEPACRSVKAELGTFSDPHGKAYGTGAVIDYASIGGQRKLMALALDSDRRFHVAFIEDAPGPSIGSARPAQFDAAAATVVRSLQSGDCNTFLRFVDRQMGLGTGGDRQVCRRVSSEPFRRELQADQRARPVALGGNAQIAFYKVRSAPTRYYTMIMARRAPSASSGGYVLVNAFPA